jgi:hypothetical protein
MRYILIEKKLLHSNNNLQCNLCGFEMIVGIRIKRKTDGTTSVLHVLRCTNKKCTKTR